MTTPLGPQPKGSSFDPTAEVWGTQGWDAIERKVRHGIEGDAFAAVGYKAWHDLGVVAPGGTSAEELLKLAKADWDVFHAPNLTSVNMPKVTAAGEPVYVPGFRDAAGNRVQQMQTVTAESEDTRNVCRINPDTGALEILGTTSPKYGIIQHKALFLEFAEALLGLTAPAVSTCGVLFGGRQVFMCWKLPDEIVVDGEDDKLQFWMLARTSHNRTIPAQVAIVPLRTVCWNTSRWNMQHAVTKMSIRHTANPSASLAQAREALGIQNTYAQELGDEVRTFLRTPMSTNEFTRIVTKEFGPGDDPTPQAQNEWDKKMAALLTEWTATEQANCQNTAWAAVNAVTRYQDWETKFSASGWEGREAGGRFLRSITDNPNVVNPKNNMIRVVREFAGVK